MIVSAILIFLVMHVFMGIFELLISLRLLCEENETKIWRRIVNELIAIVTVLTVSRNSREKYVLMLESASLSNNWLDLFCWAALYCRVKLNGSQPRYFKWDNDICIIFVCLIEKCHWESMFLRNQWNILFCSLTKFLWVALKLLFFVILFYFIISNN